jgi:pentapeptide MXKDX repeat protein
MTISTRIALGITAAALSLSLALAPAAFAQDPMKQDLDFRNSMSRDDGVKKDAISKDTGSRDSKKKDDSQRSSPTPRRAPVWLRLGRREQTA